MATKGFARRINELGCEYVDAPVSGGEVGAKAATLSIMAGGKQDVFDKVLPLLQRMGKNITLVGGNGDGQTTKVANPSAVSSGGSHHLSVRSVRAEIRARVGAWIPVLLAFALSVGALT